MDLDSTIFVPFEIKRSFLRTGNKVFTGAHIYQKGKSLLFLASKCPHRKNNIGMFPFNYKGRVVWASTLLDHNYLKTTLKKTH